MDTSRNRIIFVPGKSAKPPVAQHQVLLWDSLVTGVRHTDPALAQVLSAQKQCFQLAAWNELYYPHAQAIEHDLPWIQALLKKSGPDASDRREAYSWRYRWARLFYRLADRFPDLIALSPYPAMRSTLRETERYFDQGVTIGSEVREVLKIPLRHMFAAADRILVIGHSMGSIIAYDALWELWHEEAQRGRVDIFLTLGSPLGMRFVKTRLRGFHKDMLKQQFPGNIRHWINIAAQGDLTALDPEIRDDFAAMLARGMIESIRDLPVYTYFRNQYGLNVHRSYGYLAHPEVGRVIGDWWRSG